jgi:putative MFS transporter
MTFGAQVTITVFMPTVLVSRGFNLASSLTYTTIINVGGLVGAVMASVFGYRFKRRVVLGYGAVVAVLVAVTFGSSSQLGLILILGGLLQLMFILLNTTTWVWAPELYPTGCAPSAPARPLPSPCSPRPLPLCSAASSSTAAAPLACSSWSG